MSPNHTRWALVGLLAAAHDGDHLVQHVVRITRRDAHIHRLQTRLHTHERTVVIRAQLRDGALERQQLILGQRRQPAEVASGKDRDIGRRAHPTSLRSRVQQQAILGPQPDQDGALTGSATVCALAPDSLDPTWRSPCSGRNTSRLHLPDEQAFQPGRLGQIFTCCGVCDLSLRLYSHARLDDFRTTHGSQCVPTLSRRLSCVSSEMTP